MRYSLQMLSQVNLISKELLDFGDLRAGFSYYR
jgi:hypothetical protein